MSTSVASGIGCVRVVKSEGILAIGEACSIIISASSKAGDSAQLTILSGVLHSQHSAKRSTIIFETDGENCAYVPISQSVVSTLTNTFPATKPIDPNGAADSDTDEEVEPESTAPLKPTFVQFANVTDASEAGILLGESDCEVASGIQRYVLQTEQTDLIQHKFCIGLLHTRPNKTHLGLPICGTSEIAALFQNGLSIISANTTRSSGGKDTADTLKDMRRRFATGALVRIVPPLFDVDEACKVVLTELASYSCACIEALRKKKYMSVYLTDHVTYELDE